MVLRHHGHLGPLLHRRADWLRAEGMAVFGPSAAAARIEGSKAFAKQVMRAAGVPPAGWVDTTDPAEARAALDRFGPPFVVKQDSLAAGKGVTVTCDPELAADAVAAATRGGGRVVVEEYLDGPEVSLFSVVTETGEVYPLLPAQDAKRVGDGDTGPNTGGMGAYAPLPWLPPGLPEQVLDRVVVPTVAELARRGTPFQGLLYTGLALTSAGPRVVEFNARFGDPETQVVLELLETPLSALLRGQAPPRWRAGAAVAVVLAAPGSPQAPRLGDPVEGLDDVPPPAYVLHAGTRRDPGGRVLSAGGRVLTVVAPGGTLADARAAAYAGVDRIRLAGAHHRRDIAAVSRISPLGGS